MKKKKEVALRKLKRADLLEMLIEQSKEIESLHQQTAELQRRLDERKLQIAEVGNIAEAALKINGVMEAAQAAAQQYLDNIKLLDEQQKKEHSE